MFNLQSIVENYKIISQLKGGAQGFVFVVEDLTSHEKCVLKSMCIEDGQKSDFEKMVKIWKVLCDSKVKDFFVKYKNHFYKSTNAILIMEYCASGDLDALIKKKAMKKEKFSEVEVIKLLIEGVSALEELHSHNLIHRDVKAANFLVGDDGKFKITDFNTWKSLEGTMGAGTMVGTLEYTAPEVARSEGYSYPVDIFSLGVVLYQMMMGRTPFVNERGVNLMNLMMGKYEPINVSLGYTQALVDLVHACLSIDPALRPTPTQVLTHALVRKIQDAAALHEAVLTTVVAEVSARTAGLEKEIAEQKAAVVILQKSLAEQQNVAAEQKETIGALQRTVAECKKVLAEQRRMIDELRSGKAASLSSAPSTPSAPSPRLRTAPQPFTLLVGAVAGNRDTDTYSIVFRPQPSPAGIVFSGMKVTFGKDGGDKTIFIKQDLSSAKIFLLDLSVSGNSPLFGLAVKSAFPSLHSQGLDSRDGTCFLYSGGIYVGSQSCMECVNHPLWNTTSPAVSVRLELNQITHTLYFFVEGKQVPHCVTNIPLDVLFSMFGEYSNSSIEVRSLRSMSVSPTTATTAAGTVCKPYPWRN